MITTKARITCGYVCFFMTVHKVLSMWITPCVQLLVSTAPCDSTPTGFSDSPDV